MIDKYQIILVSIEKSTSEIFIKENVLFNILKKMDKTQRIIVILLILAILFSVASIFISFSVTNIKIPESNSPPAVTGQVAGESAGGLRLEVYPRYGDKWIWG